MSVVVESLENRALLASVGLNTATGVLTITGNSTADRIEVQRRADKGQLKVEVNGSEVTLRGTVRSWVERHEAEKAAWSAPGVTAVHNYITVSAAA